MLKDGAICRTDVWHIAGSLKLNLLLLATKQALQSNLASLGARLQLEALWVPDAVQYSSLCL